MLTLMLFTLSHAAIRHRRIEAYTRQNSRDTKPRFMLRAAAASAYTPLTLFSLCCVLRYTPYMPLAILIRRHAHAAVFRHRRCRLLELRHAASTPCHARRYATLLLTPLCCFAR